MSDSNYIGNNSGTIHQFGGRGNAMNAMPAASPASTAAPAAGTPASAAEITLYAFADIVGWSKMNVRLQRLSQDDLVAFLDQGIIEAGIRPDQVEPQNQGDARLLTFPVGTDVAKVLSALPRRLNDELVARNRDMAEHARMRVRLALCMGASTSGSAGRVGAAPVAVTRIANSDLFRAALRAAARSELGVMIDDYLHSQVVRQEFRADMSADDYVPVRVAAAEKGFDAAAWLRLFGYSGAELRSLNIQ
jgi:hypothetical protein